MILKYRLISTRLSNEFVDFLRKDLWLLEICIIGAN